MNKTDLIDSIAKEAGLSKKDAAAALDATLSAIKTALSDGDSVSILGFGTFSVKSRPERQGRNPATGESITIKASKTPAFKAGKGLKDAMN